MIIDLMKERYSVRSYSDQKVEEAKLTSILEAGRVAPTGANRQAYELLVIQSEEGFEKLSQGAKTFGAPLAILVCGDRKKAWVRPGGGLDLTEIDSAIVTDHMMLQATELGRGSVWICMLKPDVLRVALNIPDHLEPLSILAIGYSDREPLSKDRHDKLRKATSELVHFEKF